MSNAPEHNGAPHPGQAFLDIAVGRREVERLEAVAEARQRPGSVWHDSRLWDGTARASGGSSPVARSPAELVRVLDRPERRYVLNVTADCACCVRAFVGRRSTARYCGDLCGQRSRRGRCTGEAVA